MADDIAITQGTGTTVATDEISSRHYQLIKLAYGAADSATLVNTGAGLPATIQAAEAHMGQVGGQIISAATALTVTASAYTSGNCMGGKITIANIARANDITGRLTKLVMQSKSLQTFAFDVVLFNADPSASTFTDRGTFDVVAADWNKVIGVVHVSDWTALGATRSSAQALGLNIPFSPVSGARTLYAAIAVRSTPTPASTSDFSLLLSNDSD